MPAKCTICLSIERDAIETALVSRVSYPDIAGRFGVSRSALSRHAERHLPAERIEVAQAADLERARGLQERLEDLYERASAILDQAEVTGRHNVALAGIRELRGILEFAARLTGYAESAGPAVIQLSLHDGSPFTLYEPRPTESEDEDDG